MTSSEVARLRAAIWSALEAIEAGDWPLAEAILLAAIEDLQVAA